MMNEKLFVVSVSRKEFEEIYSAAQKVQEDIHAVALAQAVESLSDQQKRHLLGIVWLGRGDLHDWREVFSIREDTINLVAYLSGKKPLAEYMRSGWLSLPETAKLDTPEDYKRLAYPIVVKPTIDLVDCLLADIEHVTVELKDYLVTTSKRPGVDQHLLRAFDIVDSIYSYVFGDPGLSYGWYREKTKSLKGHAKSVVKTWLLDHSEIVLISSAPMSREEWVREKLFLNLSALGNYAGVLREAVLEDGINLIQLDSD